ncbi:MAG: hypothetical protein LC803_22965 [Acidobacteria bacterium]|nr:hypothetical protein [Acidobacteriota bacterium]
MDEGHGSLLRKLFIDSATIYTKEVSPREFVVRTNQAGQPTGPCKFFGKPASKVGALVECRDGEGSGLRIITEGVGGEEIFLPKRSGVRYEITFKNLRPHQHAGSDFQLYYDVLSDPRGSSMSSCWPAAFKHFGVLGSFHYMRENYRIFALYARNLFHFMTE